MLDRTLDLQQSGAVTAHPPYPAGMSSDTYKVFDILFLRCYYFFADEVPEQTRGAVSD